MNEILTDQYSWADLVVLSIILLGVFLLFSVAERFLEDVPSSSIRYPLKRIVHKSGVLYEPLAILMLLAIFVFINPVFNGFILTVVFVASFLHLKNYLSGRIVLLDNSMAKGGTIKVGSVQGAIARKGRLEIQVRVREGLCHIGYCQMLEQGYTMVSGENVGRLCRLSITPLEADKEVEHLADLSDLLASVPYIDWSHKPSLELANDGGTIKMEARLLLREDGHLKELAELIAEWGYACKIVPNP